MYFLFVVLSLVICTCRCNLLLENLISGMTDKEYVVCLTVPTYFDLL